MDDLHDREIEIYVRDRRKPNQYPIDNLVEDHYRPIIDCIGLDIYNLLSRVAMFRQGERASISFGLMADFLGHSRATVWSYLRLLELCGLIYRERPEMTVVQNGSKVKKKHRSGNKSNAYYLLDPKEVTKEMLGSLSSVIEADEQMDKNFKSHFLDLIAAWRPFQSYFSGNGSSRIKPVVGQMSLFDEADEDGSPPALPSELVKRILERVNIRDRDLVASLSQYGAEVVLAAIWYGRSESWVTEDRISGYVITQFQKEVLPPDNFVQLAKLWLGWSRNKRTDFIGLSWSHYREYLALPMDVCDAFDLSEPESVAAIKFSKGKHDSFSNWIEI